MDEERSLQLSNDDAWGVLSCLGYSEAVMERVRAVEMDAGAAGLHYPLTGLLHKLYRTAVRPQMGPVAFTLPELYTMALSVPPTAWGGARGFLQQVFKAILSLSGEEVDEDANPADQDAG